MVETPFFLSSILFLVLSGAAYGVYVKTSGHPWKDAWISGLAVPVLAGFMVTLFLWLVFFLAQPSHDFG